MRIQEAALALLSMYSLRKESRFLCLLKPKARASNKVLAFGVFVVMMRFYCTYLMLMLVQAVVFGQNKIDCRLLELIAHGQENSPMSIDIGLADNEQVLDTASIKQNINVLFNDDATVKEISAIARMKHDAVCPVESLNKLGISVVDVAGNVAILSIPPESLLSVEEIDEIEYVAADNINHLMNSKARTHTRVDYADGSDMEKLAESALPHPYTGKDVVIGIVDVGIDYNHAMFRDADGNTRVKKVVDFKTGSKVVYTDKSDIAALTTDNTDESHGSHTSCTAGGSRVGESDLHGMAPDAELVLCGLGGSLSESRIISSIEEIFSYADEVNKPAVINLSLGNELYFRDGVTSNLLAAIKSLNGAGKKEGRIVCISAGNSAGRKNSIIRTLGDVAEDGYCLRTVLGETGLATLDETIEVAYYNKPKLFAYDNDGGSFAAELKAVDITTGILYTLTEKPLYSSTTSTDAITSIPLTLRTDGTNNKKYVRLSNSKSYYFHEPNLRLALLVTGTAGQRMKLENSMDATSTEGFYAKDIAGYTEGNDELSINVHACDDAVISVGAYTHSASWKSINGKTYHYNNTSLRTEGSIASFSSYATDDNGVNRPDVLAPGVGVLSAYNLYDTSFFDSNGDVTGELPLIHYNESINGRNNYYGAMAGTSMASPCTAGIIALWLQANPRLSTADVREIIRQTSENDEYTTVAANIPSGDLRQAGSGKINALAGVQAAYSDATLALDDNAEYVPGTYKAGNVTYTRPTVSGNYGSFCLPFDFDINEATGIEKVYVPVNIALLNTQTNLLRLFLAPETGVIPAGTPFLAKNNGATTITSSALATFTSVMSNPLATEIRVFDTNDVNGLLTEDEDVKLTWNGTYVRTDRVDGMKSFNTDGSFGNHSSATLSPFRAYLLKTEPAGEQSIDIEYIFSPDATSIEDIISEQISQPVVIYSVSGQKVNAINKGGIYIVNGRKVVR